MELDSKGKVHPLSGQTPFAATPDAVAEVGLTPHPVGATFSFVYFSGSTNTEDYYVYGT